MTTSDLTPWQRTTLREVCLGDLPIPTPAQVCELIESMIVEADVTAEAAAQDAEPNAALLLLAYKFVHVASDPYCLHVHRDWIEEFWAAHEARGGGADDPPFEEVEIDYSEMNEAAKQAASASASLFGGLDTNR